MKRLPPITSDVRIRLEGAVEQLEFAVTFAENQMLERAPESIPSLLARWPAIEEAVVSVARHAELAPLGDAFTAARTELERVSSRECQLLGLPRDGDLLARLAAISSARVSVATPLPAVVVSQNALLTRSAKYGMGALACVAANFVSEVFLLPAVGLFGVSSVALVRWLVAQRWTVTTTHVVVKRPRETAIAIADITEVVEQAGCVVVRSRTQQLSLRHGQPRALARILTLSWRVPAHSRQLTLSTARRRTVVVDAFGVAVLRGEEWKRSGIDFSHFEPRALASACDEAYWPAAKLEFANGLYVLPDGDTFAIDAPGAYLLEVRRR